MNALAYPWRWLSGLIEWEGEGGSLVIGKAAPLAVIAAGSIAFWGTVHAFGGGLPAVTDPVGGGGGSEANLLWNADWMTCTGYGSTRCWLDSAQAEPFTAAVGQDTLLRVSDTPTSGCTHPTDNHLGVYATGTSTALAYFPPSASYYDEPSAGDSIGARFFFCWTTDETDDPNLSDHNLVYLDGSTPGGSPYNIGEVRMARGGVASDEFRIGWISGPSTSGGSNDWYADTGSAYFGFSELTTYVVEWLTVFVTDSTFTTHLRVWDYAGDSLVVDTDDFRNRGESLGASALLDDQTWTQADATGDILAAGIGGSGTDDSAALRKIYEYSALAVCDSWCGNTLLTGEGS